MTDLMWKEVLRPGVWLHPITRQQVKITPARIDAIARNTQKYIDNGNHVSLPLKHTDDPTKNTGYVRKAVVKQGSLFCGVEVADPEIEKRLGRTIRGVSANLVENHPDSISGETYSEVMTHLALTLNPVVGNTADFSVSLSGDALVPKEDRMPENIAKALGLAADADEGAIASAVTALAAERDAVKEKLVASEAKSVALAAEIVKMRETSLAAERTKFEAFVEDAKTKSAAAGRPIPETQIATIRKLFADGQTALAQDVGTFVLGCALGAPTMPTGVTPAPKPEAKKDPADNAAEVIAEFAKQFGLTPAAK